MIGKYENSSIYNEYRQVLLEQNQNDEFFLLINKIRTSSLDPATKAKLIEIVSAQKEHGVGDADAAGYASYPEAKPAIDQDDQDTVNDDTRDPSFADEMRKAQEEQQAEYPEREEGNEEPMPSEAPWWVAGDEVKKRWLSSKQAEWKRAQKEEAEEGWWESQKKRSKGIVGKLPF